MKKLLFGLLLLIGSLELIAQDFTKMTSGDLVATPSASRSANFIDANGDGWDDVFISNGPSAGQNNLLYLNNQDGTFTTLTNDDLVLDMGKSDGASWADVDNDGDLDVYVATWYGQNNFFFRNLGNGQFDRETGSPFASGSHSETANWGDYDQDGWLDLYVTNSDGTRQNFLLHNDGTGQFTTINNGIMVADANPSRSVDWIDYDEDGDLDLFVTNENNEKNDLYRNDAGSFSKITTFDITATNRRSAGSSWGDIDNDGDLDLFIANYQNQNNQLFRNDGGQFTAITTGSIVNDNGCSFGSAFADADNDGDLDLYVCNAFCLGVKNYFYRNDGNGTFVRDNSSVLVADNGWTFGCAWGDMNNDGWLDLVLANCKDENQTNALYQNNGGTARWLKIQAVGTTSNRSALGAIIRVKAELGGESIWQMRRITGQSGYCSQNSLTIHFGLLDASTVDSLVVEWPSGSIEVYENMEVDQICTITEGQGSSCMLTPTAELNIEGSHLDLLPNPTTMDKVVIRYHFQNTQTKIQGELFDSIGQLMKRFTLDAHAQTYDLDVQELAVGTYQIVLDNGAEQLSTTLIRH